MNKYIFDLDNTLYSDLEIIDVEFDNDNIEIFYNSIKPKYFLNQLIEQLSPVYLFTNGTIEHVNEVLKKLKFKNIFKNKNSLTRDEMKDSMKPDIEVFKKAIQKFELKKNDNIFFFEDNSQNLKIAKILFNWNTILINPYLEYKPEYVDYLFKTIENAVLHFVFKKNLNKIIINKKKNANKV